MQGSGLPTCLPAPQQHCLCVCPDVSHACFAAFVPPVSRTLCTEEPCRGCAMAVAGLALLRVLLILAMGVGTYP